MMSNAKYYRPVDDLERATQYFKEGKFREARIIAHVVLSSTDDLRPSSQELAKFILDNSG
jgi:hypothetical protein